MVGANLLLQLACFLPTATSLGTANFNEFRFLAPTDGVVALTEEGAAALPKTMNAFVGIKKPHDQETSAVYEKYQVPAFGELFETFAGLPTESCEVLVQISASSVNPVDRSIGVDRNPAVLGSDLAGVVAGLADSCSADTRARLPLGSAVWADIGANAQLKTNGKVVKENGAYAEYALALDTQLGAKPRSLGMAEAASLPKVALTGYKAMHWYGGAPWDRTAPHHVLVLGGSGGTGSAGIQLARALGASNVTTTCSAANCPYCLGLGADLCLDYHTTDWLVALGPDSVDTVYDTVGEDGSADKAMSALRPGGAFVTIAGKLSSKPRADVNQSKFINSDTNLDNVLLLDALAEIVERGKLRMARVKQFVLNNTAEAFAESADGHVVGKLGIVVSS